MSRLRLWVKVAVVAAIACSLGVAFAGSANAYTKAQKHRIARHLMRTLKKHPKVILTHKFYVLASHVDFTLPLTIRLNPCVATENGALTPGTTCFAYNTSNDQLKIDLGPSVDPAGAAKVVNLSGRILAQAKFLDPFQGQGEPGELSLSIPGYAAGSAGGATPSARLRTTPVPVLQNPDIAGTCDNAFFGSTTDADSSTNNPAGVPATSVFRTSFLPVGVDASLGARPSGGEAFLFGNPSGPAFPDVSVTLNTDIPVNSVIRDVNPGVGDPNNCRQSWTGAIDNKVTATAAGKLRIAPAFTLDGKLRLATVDLSGPVVHNEIDACLAPYSPFVTAVTPAFGVVAGDPTTAPAAACGTAANPLGAPVPNPDRVKLNADVSVLSLKGEALVGDVPDALPPTPATGGSSGKL